MVLVAVTVVGAITVGYLRGGRLANLGRVRLRRAWLVLVSVAAQAVPAAVAAAGGPVGTVSPPALLASHAALLVFVWCNRLLPGMLLVFAGFAANAAVITANGAMPVDRGALQVVANGPASPLEPGTHRLLRNGDSLTWLADIFPIPLLHTVISVGDVLLAAGVGILVTHLMSTGAPATGRRARRGV